MFRILDLLWGKVFLLQRKHDQSYMSKKTTTTTNSILFLGIFLFVIVYNLVFCSICDTCDFASFKKQKENIITAISETSEDAT